MKRYAALTTILASLALVSMWPAASAQDVTATEEAPVTEETINETEGALPKVLQTLEAQGVEIVGELDTPADMKAYAAIAKQQPLAIYLTPDEEHDIIGTMMDTDGMDVTQTALEAATVKPWAARTWQALSESTWVADGSEDADRVVYMFTDAICPFCDKFGQQARPWVENDHVQIRHILVSVLTDTSAGKAAAILSADNPAQALHDHESAGPENGVTALESIPVEINEQLEANNDLMQKLPIEGTPGIFYFDEAGELLVQRGAPLEDSLEEILGKQ